MLNTFLQIGQRLREDKSTVQFLPFVEFGGKNAKYFGNGDKKKLVQEKPFVQVYDVFINGENWKIKKSNNAFDENSNITFIKGNKDDRFYIAGDINANYLGGAKSLDEYFSLSQSKIIQEKLNQLNQFTLDFRKHLQTFVKEIQEQIDTHYQNNKKQNFFVQFKFHKEKQTYYWADLFNEIESIIDLIISQKYTEIINGERVLGKQASSFLSYQNLNAFQNLEQKESFKNFDIRVSIESLKDLLVANKYIAKGAKYIGKTLIQVLPAGDYSRESLLNFLGQSATYRDSRQFQESNTEQASTEDTIESILGAFEKDRNILKFDVLFLNKGGQTTDIVEYISSIDKSDIEEIKQSWKKSRILTNEYYSKNIMEYIHSEEIKEIVQNTLEKINPLSALSELLKGFRKEDKKLENHHRRVLYKIFRNQYYQDPLLLQGLINKTEYGIRHNDYFGGQFLNLFINYLYLNYVLLNPINEFTMMQKTQSYQAGMLLGELARNVDQDINSFSKQYAGNLSRRITTKEDFQKLLNFIQEKLVMHDKLYPNVRENSQKINEVLSNFTEQYKKDYAVAGFFYSYMMPFKKSTSEDVSN